MDLNLCTLNLKTPLPNSVSGTVPRISILTTTLERGGSGVISRSDTNDFRFLIEAKKKVLAKGRDRIQDRKRR